MKHVNPLVSVVMIFLNGERFIEEAIASVLAQSYPNWELLLVDDGSSDGSTGIAREHAARRPGQVRYLEHAGHQNRGMSASRNLGVRESRGAYIAFLDADDVYLPQKLERQVALLREQPEAAMVYGATLHWHSWTGREEDRRLDRPRKLGVPPDTLVRPPTLVRLLLRHQAWTPGTCGVLLRREAIELVGGFDERFRGMFEDQVFFYKLFLRATIFVESGSWDRYRQHPDSWCEAAVRSGETRTDRRPSPARGAFLRWLEQHFAEQRVADASLWSDLRNELWPYRHPALYRLSELAARLRGRLTEGGRRLNAER